MGYTTCVRFDDLAERDGATIGPDIPMQKAVSLLSDVRLLVVLVSLAWLGAAGPAWSADASRAALAQEESARPSASPSDPAAALFEEVWRTVRDRFYDPSLHGLDWTTVRGRYEPAVLAAQSDEARAALINAMLSELGASHTRLYTREEPAYYQLADIFSGKLRRDGLHRVFTGGEVTYPGIGAFTRLDSQGRTFIIGVVDGAPAARSGLLVGDEILAADGMPFRPIGSFRGKLGAPVALTVRRIVDGPNFEVSVVPEEIRPNRMFLQGMEASARIIEGARGARIGYVHVWSYAGVAFQRALERLIAEGPLKDADALVWDLRDGWGGAEPQYLDLFNARAPSMQLTNRGGETAALNVKWRKPVAMLINGGTRSGKEILAYGFKKYALGEVIGTLTAKAVLASTAFLMSDGSLLLLAVSDVRIDGERLEGIGVTPTIDVPFDSAYAAGKDPQLDRAVEALSRAVMD
jgi:carboxyl-terminal processing protease